MSAGLEVAAMAAGPDPDVAGEAAVYRDFASLPLDVQSLFDAAGALDFQAGLPWFLNFTRHVGLAHARPQLYVWREHGIAVAALPLLRREGQLASLSNYYSTRYTPLSTAGATAAESRAWLGRLLAEALRAEGPVHTLRFTPLQAGSPVETALHGALRDTHCAAFSFAAFDNWVLPVSTDWPGYLAARDGQLRNTLSRKGRRFAARGGRLQLLHGGPELDRGIAAYADVYAASWKQPEPHPQFMPGLMRAAARAGVLRLGIAWLGEQPVAAQVWMVAGGRADIYKLAHDEAHKDTSPGSLLTAMLMQHAFEVDGVQLVDYLSGNDAYKRLWMSESRPYRSIVAHNLRTARGLVGAAREGAAVLLSRLKNSKRATGPA